MSLDIKFNKTLPHYKCHKVVGALKIKDIIRTGDRFGISWKLIFDDTDYQPIVISDQWLQTHKVNVGGYIIQYKDDYISFSPAKQFEEGYTKVNP